MTTRTRDPPAAGGVAPPAPPAPTGVDVMATCRMRWSETARGGWRRAPGAAGASAAGVEVRGGAAQGGGRDSAIGDASSSHAAGRTDWSPTAFTSATTAVGGAVGHGQGAPAVGGVTSTAVSADVFCCCFDMRNCETAPPPAPPPPPSVILRSTPSGESAIRSPPLTIIRMPCSPAAVPPPCCPASPLARPSPPPAPRGPASRCCSDAAVLASRSAKLSPPAAAPALAPAAASGTGRRCGRAYDCAAMSPCSSPVSDDARPTTAAAPGDDAATRLAAGGGGVDAVRFRFAEILRAATTRQRVNVSTCQRDG